MRDQPGNWPWSCNAAIDPPATLRYDLAKAPAGRETWAMKSRVVFLFVAAFFLFVSGCLPADAAEVALRIGLSLDQSGPYKDLALMHQRAYELWREEVNQRGGILGHSIEFTLVDDAGDPARAAAIYDGLINRQHVDLLLAPYSSELTARIAPIVDGAGYPLLASGASSDRIWQQGYTNIFGMMATASRYSQGMLRLALKGGLSTVAVISAPDEFSREAGEGTAKWARYLKLKVVAEDVLAAKGADMTDVLRDAQAKGAELVVVAGHLGDAIAARRAIAGIGWQPRAFYATIGPSLPGWPGNVGDLAEGTFSTSLWEPLNRDRYGVEPSYQAATAYAAGQILEAAIASAGSLDRDKIREALYQLDTNSILGRFAVDRSGVQIKRFEMIIQWQKGRKEIVWPPELHTADAIFLGAAP
jgi:branched-chain amino acid transport system substrate-binding protein